MLKNPVGPVIRMSDEVDGIISAIRDDNPDVEIEVIDRGAYVRIMGEGRLRVSRESLMRHLGHEFEMRQLEPLLSSYAGRIVTSSDEFRWEYQRELGPTGAAGHVH